MKPLLIIIFLILNSFSSKLYSSEPQLDIWSNLKNLHLEFSDRDQKRLTRIEQRKDNAEGLIAQASSSENREDMGKAFNELFTASRELYDIYERYCKSERDDLPGTLPPELDRAFELESNAQENLNKAEILKDEAENTEELTSAKNIYMMAYDLEQMALLNLGRALRIYQDYPVMYAYDWDDDITIMEDSPERVVRVIKDDDEETVQQEESNDTSGIKESFEGITYIVQIAAHIREIPEEEIREIYSGNKEVKLMREDNWYKYYFGPYATFEKAEEVMKSLDITNVFIAAYLDGNRIGIGEARDQQDQ